MNHIIITICEIPKTFMEVIFTAALKNYQQQKLILIRDVQKYIKDT